MLKYKHCHGVHRPLSLPGAELPPDYDGHLFLSPDTSVATSVLSGSITEGAPITVPTGAPVPKPITFSNWEEDLSNAVSGDEALGVEELGRLRVEVLRRLAGLPQTDVPPSDEMVAGAYHLAAETVRTVAQLARKTPRRSIFWNEELDVAHFLGRTLLLADHVLYPDRVFDALLRGATSQELKKAAQRQLESAALLAHGIAIPVVPGVAMAARGRGAMTSTSDDLRSQRLVDWVQAQLIVEGPTAREALFVRAADDLATEAAMFWLYGHIDRDSLDSATGRFRTAMLQPYDPQHDYAPWIEQVKDAAVGALVQRTNERVVTADVFGSEYVSASLFEARLLRNRANDSRIGSAQAAMWADVPELTRIADPDLAKILRYEDAVEDLRRQVRASLETARTDAASVDAITDLAHGLESASHKVERAARTDRTWQRAVPAGLGGASIVIGGVTGGLAGLGIGALGALGGLAPYLGTRLNTRRDAAFLFVAARRTRR